MICPPPYVVYLFQTKTLLVTSVCATFVFWSLRLDRVAVRVAVKVIVVNPFNFMNGDCYGRLLLWMVIAMNSYCFGWLLLWMVIVLNSGCCERWLLWTVIVVNCYSYERLLLWTWLLLWTVIIKPLYIYVSRIGRISGHMTLTIATFPSTTPKIYRAR